MDLFADTPFERADNPWNWVRWLLLLFIVLGLILGYKFGRVWKRRRRAVMLPICEPTA